MRRFDPHTLAIILAFLLALSARMGVVLFQGMAAPPKFSAQPDQIEYEELAWSMASGRGYVSPGGHATANRPPGTSLTLLPVYLLAGRSFAAGRAWFCLLSALTCVSAAWLASLCFGRPVGVIAAFWLALYPGHLYYPLHFVSEVPYAFWLTLACALTMKALTGGAGLDRVSLLAGACWGLAVLTRPQAIVVLPVAIMLALTFARSARERLLPLAVMMCTMSLVLAPWLVRNRVVLGAATLSTVGGATFWGANNEVVSNADSLRGSWIPVSRLASDGSLDGNELEQEAAAWRHGLDFLNRNRASVPALVAMKVWRLVTPFEETENRIVWWAFACSWLITGPFALAGLGLALADRRPASAVLLTPLVATLVTAIVFYGSVRFRDSVIPLLLILAARAAAEAVAGWRVPAMALLPARISR